MRLISDVYHSRLSRVFCFLMLVWTSLTFVLNPVQQIEIYNAMLFAAGLGVTIAYLPGAWVALRTREPTQGQILCLGVLLAWFAISGERVYSLVGRTLHKDITFFNTNLHTFFIFLTLLAGFCHLAAPEAINGALPPRTWARMGVLCALAVLIITALAVWNGF